MNEGLPEELQSTDSPQGLARSDWTQLANQIRRGARAFWARRGIPEPDDGWHSYMGARRKLKEEGEDEQTVD